MLGVVLLNFFTLSSLYFDFLRFGVLLFLHLETFLIVLSLVPTYGFSKIACTASTIWKITTVSLHSVGLACWLNKWAEYSVSSIPVWALNMKSSYYVRPGSGNFWRKVHEKWKVSSSDYCVALLRSRIMALSADNLVVECWLYGWLVTLQYKGESSLISIISANTSMYGLLRLAPVTCTRWCKNAKRSLTS